MSEHHAEILWRRTSADFTYATYNREHEWRFKGGVVVQASAAPQFRGSANCPDPEDAFVASLSSCHMLTFLAIASRKRYVIDAYDDDAVGHMTKNEAGRLWVSHVTLRPKIAFSGPNQPSAEEISAMHHTAHENCFIANSVSTQITVEAQ